MSLAGAVPALSSRVRGTPDTRRVTLLAWYFSLRLAPCSCYAGRIAGALHALGCASSDGDVKSCAVRCAAGTWQGGPVAVKVVRLPLRLGQCPAPQAEKRIVSHPNLVGLHDLELSGTASHEFCSCLCH